MLSAEMAKEAPPPIVIYLVINSDLLSDPQRIAAVRAATLKGAGVLVLSRNGAKRAEAISNCTKAGIEARMLEGLMRSSDVVKARIARCERCIVVGLVDNDLFSSKHSLVPLLWFLEETKTSSKVIKYGLGVSSARFADAVDIFANAKSLFRTVDFVADNIPITVMAAARANYKYNVPEPEAEALKKAEDILKRRLLDDGVVKVLQMYLVAVTRNNKLLEDVEDWGIFPSSAKGQPDPEAPLSKLMDALRYASNHSRKRRVPLFTRTETVSKSHYGGGAPRTPGKHLDSIVVSSDYGSLKGRTVAVIDDYWTTGASFEAARALLTAQEVKKVRILCAVCGNHERLVCMPLGGCAHMMSSSQGSCGSPGCSGSNVIHPARFLTCRLFSWHLRTLTAVTSDLYTSAGKSLGLPTDPHGHAIKEKLFHLREMKSRADRFMR